ncbi:MAG TPA: hypothetical protein DCZ40_02305 [Lachnospiraceae bacterium]|nr:hypothetical protein [Lachnospiraceae bacterium]
MKMLQKIRKKTMVTGILILVSAMGEVLPVSAAELPVMPEQEGTVLEGEKTPETEIGENNTDAEEPQQKEEVQNEPASEGAETIADGEAIADDGETAEKQQAAVSADQFQTINFAGGILTDWQQISDALKGLTPEMLTNGDAGSGVLLLQLQNVENIPAEIKESITAGEGGYAKILQCSLGSGVSVVLNGASDMGGFNGISNLQVSVASEKRGKKSVATTVQFASHEDIGAVASLQVNLPQCSKGTKVSVYAETVAIDEEGNVLVGENACIGNTKAGENGNVEIPIQSTANYMFVYKEAKED